MLALFISDLPATHSALFQNIDITGLLGQRVHGAGVIIITIIVTTTTFTSSNL